MGNNISIIVGADLVPTKSNLKYFQNKDISALLGEELYSLIEEADLRIFNLEAPITSCNKRILKSGPNLRIDPSATEGLKALNPTVLSLANNHIKDYGSDGIVDTFRNLNKARISYVGAGIDLDEARKEFSVVIKNKRISVLSFAEHEFTIADDTSSGANPYDPLTSFDDVRRVSSLCDYLIVLYHGGKEHYRYPTIEQKRICRYFLSCGADIVICQHSHCIGSAENVDGKTVVYGQGNFIFDACNDECWQTSLLVKIVLGEKVSVDYVPIVKKNEVVRLPSDDEKHRIMEGFEARSKSIMDDMFLKKKQSEAAAASGMYYLRKLHGAGFVYKVIDKLTGGLLTKLIYRKSKITETINCIECETHRDMILEYLHSILDN